jgi:outer membrane protein assembly factor BamE (lipoprotein component of BamABCDE complex)
MLKLTLAALAVVLLTGCATSGNDSLRNHDEGTVSTYITEGETTKSEVMEVFGSPFNTSFTDGGREIWEYAFSDISADAVAYIPVVNWFGTSASGTQKKLTIMFDDEIVQRYSMTESDVRTGTGLYK